ncbi:F0F1 ATP synthase subunit delta [Candidatus Uhrbacteria bacterium]|nr:F0F1 ATP synthase subunit delta [Candidatus Uhrbacteria bacterium]
MRHPLKHYALALYHAVHEPGATLVDIAKNFVRLLERDGVIAKYDAILRLFLRTWDAEKKVVSVAVVTARPLPHGTRKALEEHVQSAVRAEAVDGHYSVDAALLGGAVMQVGDTRVDGSVRRQLATLKNYIIK